MAICNLVFRYMSRLCTELLLICRRLGNRVWFRVCVSVRPSVRQLSTEPNRTAVTNYSCEATIQRCPLSDKWSTQNAGTLHGLC